MGVVGSSKRHSFTHELATSLLLETQSRGQDATGYFSIDCTGNYRLFKKNIPAERFIRHQAWRNLSTGYQAMIGHTRMATHGSQLDDINNHPHVSDDYSTAIVHNGIIHSFEGIAERNNINLKSQCDSEIILRLIESCENPVDGIKKLFAEADYGSFACTALILDKTEQRYFFYVFRNTSPAYMIDLKKELGQFFFCSCDQIWRNALKNTRLSGIKADLIRIPSDEIWKIDPQSLEIETFNVPKTFKSHPYMNIGTLSALKRRSVTGYGELIYESSDVLRRNIIRKIEEAENQLIVLKNEMELENINTKYDLDEIYTALSDVVENIDIINEVADNNKDQFSVLAGSDFVD